MAIPTFDADLNIISALDDQPNATGGMTAAELKQQFDMLALTVQSYINEVLVPTLNRNLGLFTPITALDDTVTDNADRIPLSSAVYDALDGAKAARMKDAVTFRLTNGATGSVSSDLSSDVEIPVSSIDPDYMARPLPILKGGTGTNNTRDAKRTFGLTNENILNFVYPVGSIYITVADIDPNTLFNIGTWTRIKDRFLLAAGDTYAAGGVGGEATHVLTENEMPSHRHRGQNYLFYDDSGSYALSSGNYYSLGTPATSYTGGGEGHNNMPPYLVVYVWRRDA